MLKIYCVSSPVLFDIMAKKGYYIIIQASKLHITAPITLLEEAVKL